MKESIDPYIPPERRSRGLVRAGEQRPKLPVGFMPMVGLGTTFLNLIWIGMTSCMCGHTSYLTSATVIPSFLVLLGLQISGRHNPIWDRILGLIFLIVQGGLLAKNAADILWLGHSALLG